ncbi:hypothetical protein T02_1518 [Trichinella nativa]|uniref:Uncharacterized protein n=1 Tax=Trichinella nativa TaxID=6335 RepID=A0A0V1LH77_9BILA|nr:hypothetical protein T02_1518 [Trichinella nativa]
MKKIKQKQQQYVISEHVRIDLAGLALFVYVCKHSLGLQKPVLTRAAAAFGRNATSGAALIDRGASHSMHIST